MDIDKGLILKKLKILEKHVHTIEYMDFTLAELMKSVDIQDLISFRLQQAVETAIDTANHLASALALPQEETAADVFVMLAKKKIISKKLAEQIKDACGFRNLVVHRYGEIDFRKVYRNYKDDINDLRQFAKEIYQFLEKQK